MTVKPNSQNARILEVLADGELHSTAEIHRRAGTSRLNSRIAELRKAGYPIGPCERVPGQTGTEAYAYQLGCDEACARHQDDCDGFCDHLPGHINACNALAEAASRVVESTAAVVADESGEAVGFRHDGPATPLPVGTHGPEGYTQMSLLTSSQVHADMERYGHVATWR